MILYIKIMIKKLTKNISDLSNRIHFNSFLIIIFIKLLIIIIYKYNINYILM